jgi:hypothetical protein
LSLKYLFVGRRVFKYKALIWIQINRIEPVDLATGKGIAIPLER